MIKRREKKMYEFSLLIPCINKRKQTYFQIHRSAHLINKFVLML